MSRELATEYVIMGVLMKTPMHGYEIAKFLNGCLGDIWRVGSSRLYLLLQKLESEGLLDSLTTSQSNRPPRRIYRITTEGRGFFLSWVRSSTAHVRELRSEFLVKLFFLKHLKLPGGIALVDSQVHLLKGLREKIDRKRATAEDPFLKVVLGFRRSQFDACLSWLQNEVLPFQEILERRNSSDCTTPELLRELQNG